MCSLASETPSATMFHKSMHTCQGITFFFNLWKHSCTAIGGFIWLQPYQSTSQHQIKQQFMRNSIIGGRKRNISALSHVAKHSREKPNNSRGATDHTGIIMTKHWGRQPASSAHPSHPPGLLGSSVGCPAPPCCWCTGRTAPRRDVWCRPRTSLAEI